MKKYFIIPIVFCFLMMAAFAQKVSLTDVLNEIHISNPSLKVYDANIQSLDAKAKGAHNWMPPEFGTGFWMTPYNPKYIKGDNGSGMGQYMISAMQAFPNKKKAECRRKIFAINIII